ncbi:MAG: hypothetical protein JKY81_10395 [Colwellia sp.]|nr:hypothetical protein [Colwellia sp.]
MLTKKIIALMVVVVLLAYACEDDRPSYKTVQDNFFAHQRAFKQIADIVCQMGKVKQPYSYTQDEFGYGFESTKAEHRIKNLDALLIQVRMSELRYQKTKSGQCMVSLQYFVRGFAGSGFKFDYNYQVETPKPYDAKKHSFKQLVDAAKKDGKDFRFDMPLADGWYFTFIYT